METHSSIPLLSQLPAAPPGTGVLLSWQTPSFLHSKLNADDPGCGRASSDSPFAR